MFADGAPGLDRVKATSWVRAAAFALSAYFGRYAVTDYGLLVIAEPGTKIGHATTFGHTGSATRIHVGTDADDDAFRREVLVHEIVTQRCPICRDVRSGCRKAMQPMSSRQAARSSANSLKPKSGENPGSPCRGETLHRPIREGTAHMPGAGSTGVAQLSGRWPRSPYTKAATETARSTTPCGRSTGQAAAIQSTGQRNKC